MRQAFRQLLDNMELPLPAMIKPGDRVLVKPFLHYGLHSPDSRMVSHPEMVASVIEALKDCGAVITLGDEGSKTLRQERVRDEDAWIHELARRTGTELVSFAKTGARRARSGLHFPKTYLISRAVLEADHVVNCANFQAHTILGMSGAVKNMFNAVVGQCQQNLHELFANPRDLARVVVDVCAVVKPAISFLDLTSVRDPGGEGLVRPVGLMLAGRDPVAVDAVATRAVGWDPSAAPTLAWGEKHGLGCADLDHIALRGLAWTQLQEMPLGAIKARAARPEKFYAKTTRLMNKTVLRPRPVVVAAACTGCGDCAQICPVQAIHPADDGKVAIRLRACADCQVCMTACGSGAIGMEYVGLARMLRQVMHRPLGAGAAGTERSAASSIENEKGHAP